MKGGQTPIHIQRFAPADYHSDEYVQLLEKRRNYLTLTFYRHFIDYAFMTGGDLPADREALAAVLNMPRRDVDKALEFCLGRLVFQEGDRLYQRRVKREVDAELEYRRHQAEVGKLGGRPKRRIKEEGQPKARVSGNLTPPSSSPAPAPAPLSPPVPNGTVVDGASSAPDEADDGSGRYVGEVLDLYARLPGTRDQPTKVDRRTAAELHGRGVPLEVVRAGLLLATSRRELRTHEKPLPPIGSLAYFLDAIEEARASPPDSGYVEHLAARIAERMKAPEPLETVAPREGQKGP